MSLLTTKQQHELVGFIVEDFGGDLDEETFTDAVLLMFEDIAGLDSAHELAVRSTVTHLWKIYDDQH
jgi:hypothetical protein